MTCTFFAALVMIVIAFPSLTWANDETDILSKSDASVMFAMSLDQWNTNVRRAVETGAAQAMRSKTGALTMVVQQPGGWALLTKPYYFDNPRRPNMLQVVVVYSPAFSSNFTPSMIEDVKSAAVEQMRPEYDVVALHEQISGRLTFTFMITEQTRSK